MHSPIYYHMLSENLSVTIKDYHPPMRERELSPSELLAMFEPEKSLRMAFIPHLLTQIALYFMDCFVQSAREARLSQYKRHTRAMKAIRDDYRTALQFEMRGNVFERFEQQRDDYLRKCSAPLVTMPFTFLNRVKKSHPDIAPCEEMVVTYAHIVVAVVGHVAEFDRKVNREISRKLQTPCRNGTDARLSMAADICRDITSRFPVAYDGDTALCMRVITNKAIEQVKEML